MCDHHPNTPDKKKIVHDSVPKPNRKTHFVYKRKSYYRGFDKQKLSNLKLKIDGTEQQ
jgi:hypothetical protein